MLYVALLALALGYVVGMLGGGNIGNLRHIRTRGLWLALVPLAIQYALFVTPLGSALGPAVGPLHVLTYGLLLIPVALNLHLLGMRLIGVGIALNMVVIAVNGGFMPVSIAAMQAAGAQQQVVVLEATGRNQKSVPMSDATSLAVLADWLPLPFLGKVISVGDVAIAAGGMVLVAGGMRRRDETSDAR